MGCADLEAFQVIPTMAEDCCLTEYLSDLRQNLVSKGRASPARDDGQVHLEASLIEEKEIKLATSLWPQDTLVNQTDTGELQSPFCPVKAIIAHLTGPDQLMPALFQLMQ